ncbi:zinc finger HIT domain-containing protein 3 isoform X2 [Stegostoma tigrinum]|uniref:zinc finger HIT domain-containing protein 3 isoform X2 n=1 Tax=Stegostoma tigrinum TaxID=3053191 RepID=UPI002870924C|nr:zinc finger HIT domain-containing protein 3 isoform X2 [Stegostoma tigrinum]
MSCGLGAGSVVCGFLKKGLGPKQQPSCTSAAWPAVFIQLYTLSALLFVGCSVGCYKKHKDDCKPQKSGSVSTISELSPPFKKPIQQDNNGHYSCTNEILDDDDEESDRVPLEKLRQLGSEKLKGLLCNPHLKQLLLTVDKAEDKESIMKTAMQEPIFVEFADQCLQIVEPPEKNETAAS